ncbi:MAG: Stp1/IreP family PP2C-type Ser/Thr phosphatase [Christensenellaceae bacterium]|nr:Stp1/IreP family PP2C-type Ser/Thr phosphatase [Christensenellaceae bacterium]
MKFIAKTNIGLVRKANQDAIIIKDDFCAVADGMGGHLGGEVASKTAIEILNSNNGFVPDENSIKALFKKINLYVYNEQLQNEGLKGMGTTLTALWRTNKKIFIGHVGDSRCYLIRKKQIKQITKDHSYVADLINLGIITNEQARFHPYRNVINRAIGIKDDVEVDVVSIDYKKRDIFLLCSDGLNSMINDETILNIVLKNKTKNIANVLVDEALKAGGKDNVSVVVALVEEDPS